MSGKTSGLVGKLAVLLIFLILLAGGSVLLECAASTITDMDITAGIDFLAGFWFCLFYNYIFKN